MNILSLRDLQNSGGASIAANRISDVLRLKNSKVLRMSSDGNVNNFNKTLFLGKKYNFLLELLSFFSPPSNIAQLRNYGLNKQLKKFLKVNKFDIINIHNIHSADWSISLVKTALSFAPVVWTLHDCWSFLGTYYPSYCNPSSPRIKKEIKTFWKDLKNQKLSYNLTAVTPSEWMNKLASTNSWSNFDVQTIHNPVPDSFFENRETDACKKSLGLSTELPVVLCIAGDLNEERKGGSILNDILSSKLNTQAQFLLVGNYNKKIDASLNIKDLGFISDELSLQIIYHAADLLVHPAPIDNLPNTVTESISCGTPVLAFSTGGIPEIIKENESGWLVHSKNSNALCKKLLNVLNNKSYLKLRNSTRRLAKKFLNYEYIGNKYAHTFKEILNQR